jgi:DNA-binding response OmpR family regulator
LERKRGPNAATDLNLAFGSETILLLSRDIESRILIRNVFFHRGYLVLEAANEQHAAVIYGQMRGNIDLVITDASPSQVLSWGEWHRSTCKILMLVDSTNTQLGTGPIDAQVGYLVKPFTAEEVLSTVRAVLDPQSVDNCLCNFCIDLPGGERPRPLTSYENMSLLNRFAPRQKTSVLIVDDDESLRRIVAALLEAAGFEVTQASNGREVLSRAGGLDADVVLTEIVMPEVEGLQLIRELLELNPRLNIIAMSGAERAQNYLAVARSLGAKATLRKPLHGEELLRILRQVLDQQ